MAARLAVRRLLEELEDDLREHDEWTEVSELVARLFSRGTSAARQLLEQLADSGQTFAQWQKSRAAG